MIRQTRLKMSRRSMAGAALAAGLARLAGAADRPALINPIATAGDPVGPVWESPLEISVGPGKADLTGTSEKAIQAAVDYAARWGGGTVRVLPGTYRLRNAVFLRSGVRIVGSGQESVLLKEPSIKTSLAEDADFYQQEVTLADPKGIQPGDGVCFRVRNHRTGQVDIFTRTLVARSGNRFKLDRPLPGFPGIVDLWLKGEPVVTTLFSLFCGEQVADAAIENITLDGNKANNEFLNGNYVGAIYLSLCNRITIRGVTARNFNGDGMSWQTSHDIVVEDCHSHDNAGLGLHPGSGAQRPVVRRNRLERNDIGFYFCWGVRYGLLEDCVMLDNARYGISVGHNDTDNLIRGNEVRRSGRAGVIFRIDRGARIAPPHRNRLESNRIFDSGGDDGVGIDVTGPTEGITIARNEVIETRQPMKRIGVRISAEAKEITLIENRIEGFSVPVADLRRG